MVCPRRQVDHVGTSSPAVRHLRNSSPNCSIESFRTFIPVEDPARISVSVPRHRLQSLSPDRSRHFSLMSLLSRRRPAPLTLAGVWRADLAGSQANQSFRGSTDHSGWRLGVGGTFRQSRSFVPDASSVSACDIDILWHAPNADSARTRDDAEFRQGKSPS